MLTSIIFTASIIFIHSFLNNGSMKNEFLLIGLNFFSMIIGYMLVVIGIMLFFLIGEKITLSIAISTIISGLIIHLLGFSELKKLKNNTHAIHMNP